MAKADRLAKKAKRRKWKQFREIGFLNMFKVWRRGNNKHVEVDAALATYVERFAISHLSQPLTQLYAESLKQEHNAMQIDPTEAQFLKLLIHLTKAKKALEIGTFRGWSAAIMAEALLLNEVESAKVVAGQNDGGASKMVTIESRAEQAEMAKKFWETYLDPITRSRIHMINKPAREVLEIFDRGGELVDVDSEIAVGGKAYFDLIFIDADKANYGEYLKYAKKFLQPGGIIVLDNMLNAGLVATSASDRTTNAIRELNTQIFTDADFTFEPFMIPAWDGVVILRKKHL